jgi:hypothetical protein
MISRLENFLRSSRGKILHVNPENPDASDRITNRGDTPFTPFKSLQRALVEAARFSYQIGDKNDRFNFCTILLYPGEHLVDNRPGLLIDDLGGRYLRNGSTTALTEFDLTTIFDITNENNKLYLLNSVYGGVIVPRGTSIVAQDIRKTVIRPLYVPDSRNENIERSAIFRTTGASFFYSFSIEDAKPNGFCYKNYNNTKFTPNFSHHKLTAFEYVDGVNPVKIKDTFLDVETTRTDLQQYYEKISLVYGSSSGREIDDVNYIGGVSVDIQPVIDEFRIVGPRSGVIGITTIISGDGTTPSSTVTVTLDENAEGIDVDTSIQISDVNVDGYDGQFVVSSVPSPNQITYTTSEIPTNANPSVFGATLNIISDTTSSSSPYIFNVSLKSVYGMCGLFVDGSKVSGFKSVVVAQFTAISLQKDNDAFVIYDEESGNYLDSTVVPNLYKNTRSRYKPEFAHYHIKLTNDAYAQLVSVFSIGCASQIVVESGGDYSVTNSSSNFGAKTFIASGYKKDSFTQDDQGYIIGVVPPREIENDVVTVNYPSIDVDLTLNVSTGAATTDRLYLHNETNLKNPPEHYKQGFKIGAKIDETLYIETPIPSSSKIVIPGTTSSYEKVTLVQRGESNFDNEIISGVFALVEPHSFSAAEKVRVVSQNGHLPDGVVHDRVYYVIESSIDSLLGSDEIKLAATKNDAINNTSITPNRKGGKLSIVSRVSDKIPNEPGHPIQWDSSNNNWYISVDENDNGIYNTVLERSGLNTVTGSTYIERILDTRKEDDKLYKLLYCIPKNISTSARPPINGFVIQESGDTSLSGSEFSRYFGSETLATNIELRNPKFISDAKWSNNVVTITTELPHKLNVGDFVEIKNVTPVGYNGTYLVKTTPTARAFTYDLETTLTPFSNNTRVRDLNLPTVTRKDTRNIFKIYKSQEVQKFIRNKQDGLYELTVIHSSVRPTIEPFTNHSFSQPVKNLYPQLSRDNTVSDPKQTVCFADHNLIGNVVVDNPQHSIAKEAVNKFNIDLNVGIAITSITTFEDGNYRTHIINTSSEHNLSGITSVSLVSAGSSYIAGTYYGVGQSLDSGANSTASFKIVIDANQSVSDIDIMYGGSGYSVGDTISINSGIGTTTGFVPASVEVVSVNSPVGKTISLYNFTGDFSGYNDSYVISTFAGPKTFNVTSSSPISGYSTSLIEQNAFGRINGNTIFISSLSYNNFSGIGIVTTTTPHGISENTKVKISGLESTFYNRTVDVVSIVSPTSLEVDFGVTNIVPSTNVADGIIISPGISPIKGKSRISYYYSGITATVKTELSSDASESVSLDLNNAEISGLKIGDYIESNGEIMRIKSNIESDLVSVYRAQFGTERKTHPINSFVRKISIVPIEFRRNSIIKASGHTFEDVGYGSGNYSTSLPENQDREIEKNENLISKSTKDSAGAVYYSGMDENGDFYSANIKLFSSTGEQEIYDLPAPTVEGETSPQDSLNIVSTQRAIVSDSIKVNGGDSNDIISEFDGPVVFNKKLTSYAKDGIEATSIFLKGNQKVARKYSVSDGSPGTAGNYGDISFEATPTDGDNIGWIYTTNEEWVPWGLIGESGTRVILYSGTESDFDDTVGTVPEGVVDKLKFVGDPNGFGIDVDLNVDEANSFATITLRNPIDVINFGNSTLGIGGPTIGTRSPGTRVVYYDNTSDAEIFFDGDFATGIGTDYIWYSIPRDISQYQYKWFAGETEIMSLNGNGELVVSGDISGNITGTAANSIVASNLNRSINAGNGLGGGGVLTQDRTISINLAGAQSGLAATSGGLSVDNTVVRNFGERNISGITTFTNNVFFNSSASIGGNLNLDKPNFSWRFSTQEDTGILRILRNTIDPFDLSSTYVRALELDTSGNLQLFAQSIFTGFESIESGGNLKVHSSVEATGDNDLVLSAKTGYRINSPNISAFEITGGATVKITGQSRIGIEGSSLRFKREIEDANYDDCENVILSSRPVFYKSKPEHTDEDPENVYFGFIAEEVAEVDPKLVVWRDSSPLSVAYERFTVPLVKVVQKQHEIIEEQKQKISELESELEIIKDVLKKAKLL